MKDEAMPNATMQRTIGASDFGKVKGNSRAACG